MKIKKRLSIEEYALRIAEVAALRSEDPYQQVGACALSHDNRVVALAYNGLPAGFNANAKFWKDRAGRRDFMLHAEQNLCSLFKRGDVRLVAVTLQPCDYCIRLLIAHDVNTIIYRKKYTSIEHKTNEICLKYNVDLRLISRWTS